jgi:hypothetical protein
LYLLLFYIMPRAGSECHPPNSEPACAEKGPRRLPGAEAGVSDGCDTPAYVNFSSHGHKLLPSEGIRETSFQILAHVRSSVRSTSAIDSPTILGHRVHRVHRVHHAPPRVREMPVRLCVWGLRDQHHSHRFPTQDLGQWVSWKVPAESG